MDEDWDRDQRYSGPHRDPVLNIKRKDVTGSLLVVPAPFPVKQQDEETAAARAPARQNEAALGFPSEEWPADQNRPVRYDSELLFPDARESASFENKLLYFLCCGCCKGEDKVEVLIEEDEEDDNRGQGRRMRDLSASSNLSYSYSLPYDGSYRPPIVKINPIRAEVKPVDPQQTDEEKQ